MAQMFRWQWMWKSRSRLLALGSATVAFGGIAIAYAVTRDGPFGRSLMMIVLGGATLIVGGGYQLLQGLLSPAGAFGDPEARERPHRKKRRPKPAPEPEPLPLESETREPQ
jgi:hypothetical protein